MELLHLDENQAYYQLRKLVGEGRAKKVGGGRNVRYEEMTTRRRMEYAGRTVLIRDYPLNA